MKWCVCGCKSLSNSPFGTDWVHTSWALVELEWRLKVFPSALIFVLKFTASRYTLLYLNFEIYIVHVIDCEWSRSVNFPLRVFCMRYKHLIIQHRLGVRHCSRSFKSRFKNCQATERIVQILWSSTDRKKGSTDQKSYSVDSKSGRKPVKTFRVSI